MSKLQRSIPFWLLLAFLLVCCKQDNVKSTTEISKVEIKEFVSSIDNSSYSYHLYRPNESLAKKEPYIIYLLHGHGGSDNDWFSAEEGSVKAILDSLTLAGSIPALTAVCLDASNSWYVNRESRMETIYIDEFIPFIEQTYFEKQKDLIRLIAGNSAGGFGALRFGLKYPEMFKSVILLSPAAYHPVPPENSSSRKIEVFKQNEVFNDSIWQSFGHVAILNDTISHPYYPDFFISSGLDDNYGIAEVVRQLNAHLEEAGIRTSLTFIKGGHSWDVWQNRFKFDLINALNTPK